MRYNSGVFQDKKRHIITGLVLGLCCLAYLSCGSKKPVKIAFAASLSGRISQICTFARNGVELAVSKANEAGGINGRPIELLIRDVKNDVETAMEVDRELINKEEVVAIIGHITSQLAEAVVTIVDSEDILMISPTMGSKMLNERDDRFLRTTSDSGKAQAKLLAKKAQDDGVTSVAIAVSLANEAFARGLAADFSALAEGVDVAQPVGFGPDAVFESVADELLAAESEAILIVASAIDTATLAQQLSRKEFTGRMYGVSWAKTDELIKLGGGAVEGMVLVHSYAISDPTPEYQEFVTRYAQEYKEEPPFVAARAYDAANILIEGLKLSKGKMQPDDIKNAILSKGTFKGLTRDIVFDSYGDAEDPFALSEIKKGAFLLVSR